MDDLTPMEPAEILEVYEPAKQSPEQVGYYGTCPLPKKRRHMGLIVFICVLLLLTGGVILFLNFYEIRLTRTDDGYGMYILRRGSTLAVPSNNTQPGLGSTGAETPTIDLNDVPSNSDMTTEMSLQEIYQTVLPSVVSVMADGGQSIGTGVIIDQDGYIVTSYHVVESGAEINVLRYDNASYLATIVASDEISDLAVLKIDAAGLVAAEFGDSDALQVGDEVVAIGNPLGIELCGTMTNGIISAINRNLDLNGTKMTLIQTNAALNNGNSGGPLINSYGQVIGINTAKISTYYTSSSVEGIGFAIPSATVKHIVDELLTSGYVTGRPSMRLTVSDMIEVQRVYLGLPKGVYITDIAQDSNAYAAGIRYGDIIVSVDGTEIANTSDYTSKLASLSAGDTVQVIIYRGGALWSADVTLEEQVG